MCLLSDTHYHYSDTIPISIYTLRLNLTNACVCVCINLYYVINEVPFTEEEVVVWVEEGKNSLNTSSESRKYAKLLPLHM